jgi:hypothetical protein
MLVIVAFTVACAGSLVVLVLLDETSLAVAICGITF